MPIVLKSSSFKQASTFKSSKSFFDMRAIQEVHLQSFASTRLVSDTVNIGESWRSAGWGHHRRNALHLTSASHRRLKGKACCRNVEKRGKQTESQLRSLRTRKNRRSISLSHYHAQLNWWLTASLSWWFGIRYAPMTGSILHELTPSISFPQILKSCPVGTRGVVLDLGPLRSKKSVEVQGRIGWRAKDLGGGLQAASAQFGTQMGRLSRGTAALGQGCWALGFSLEKIGLHRMT